MCKTVLSFLKWLGETTKGMEEEAGNGIKRRAQISEKPPTDERSPGAMIHDDDVTKWPKHSEWPSRAAATQSHTLLEEGRRKSAKKLKDSREEAAN